MMQQKNKITGVPNVETLLWYSPEYDDITNISFPLDAKFEQAEVFAMRSSWTNNDGIYLAGMGGYNNYNHWHVGSGNYVLDAMGEHGHLITGRITIMQRQDISVPTAISSIA